VPIARDRGSGGGIVTSRAHAVRVVVALLWCRVCAVPIAQDRGGSGGAGSGLSASQPGRCGGGGVAVSCTRHCGGGGGGAGSLSCAAAGSALCVVDGIIRYALKRRKIRFLNITQRRMVKHRLGNPSFYFMLRLSPSAISGNSQDIID
jgi:hypothetical protein